MLGKTRGTTPQQVKSDTGDPPLCFQVWIWSKAKFINRKFLMEELYQRFLEGEDVRVAQEDDPFWDPVEVVHLGSAHVWLQPLAYCMKLEEQVEFLNCDGLEEAMLHIHVAPCSPAGQCVSPWSASRKLFACLSSPAGGGQLSAKRSSFSQDLASSNWVFAMAAKSADLECSRAW